jgi:hypothetical protein
MLLCQEHNYSKYRPPLAVTIKVGKDTHDSHVLEIRDFECTDTYTHVSLNWRQEQDITPIHYVADATRVPGYTLFLTFAGEEAYSPVLNLQLTPS